MTLKEVQALSDEELRIKVAELCGWEVKHTLTGSCWVHCCGKQRYILPNYPQDLNAMHKAEADMNTAQWMDYIIALDAGGNPESVHDWKKACHATARQRAEAFVLTMESM